MADDDPEVNTIAALGESSTTQFLVDPARYSSWIHYKRVLAWVLRFRGNLIAKTYPHRRDLFIGGSLTVEGLIQAKTYAVQKTQKEAFPDELKTLSKNKPLPSSSSL